MQAVVLAGGKGTRLKPYTTSFPKPLVPVGDYPILEILIRQLAKQGFDKIVISTGHLAELIQAFCGDGKKWGVSLTYVHEDTPLNTAGALKLIPHLEENFLTINGDILTTLNYRDFFNAHLQKGALGSIACKTRDTKIDFGVLETNSDQYLTNYIEKPVYTFLVSMGAYAFSRKAVELINHNESIGMPDLFLKIKNSGKKVYCHQPDCYWLDIGRIDDYEKAQEEFLKRPELFLHGS